MLSKISSFVAVAQASGISYNYASNGADWSSLTGASDCALTNQSPINLVSYNNDNFEYKTYKSTDDMIQKQYSNQFASSSNFNGHTEQLDLDVNDGNNGFFSEMGEKLYGSATEFNGIQFHFHAGSEHTVDGVRQDLEMHTVHTAKETLNDVGYAAVGVMFSVEDYTSDLSWAEQKVVDTFFDSLKWNAATTTADVNGDYLTSIDMATYGDLMQMVDSNNRWVYKGSVTTPPCGRFVYWNVLSTVYPISKKHLELFKARLNLGESGQLDERGNWREIQKEDEHAVAYIMTGGQGENVMYTGLVVGVIVLGVVSFLLLVCVTCMYFNKEDSPKKQDGIEMTE